MASTRRALNPRDLCKVTSATENELSGVHTHNSLDTPPPSRQHEIVLLPAHTLVRTGVGQCTHQYVPTFHILNLSLA